MRIDRSRRRSGVAFALLCVLLTAIAGAALWSHLVLAATTTTIWGLTPFGWVLLDVGLALLLAPLIYRPRPALTPLALALVLADAVLLWALAPAGRYTAAFSLLAVFIVGVLCLVARRNLRRAETGRRESEGLSRRTALAAGLVLVFAVGGVAVSLVASHHYQTGASVYARSPDGRRTLVYVKQGSAPWFPSVVVTRDVWGLLRQDRVVAGPCSSPRPKARWLDDRTVAVDRHRYDIYADVDYTGWP